MEEKYLAKVYVKALSEYKESIEYKSTLQTLFDYGVKMPYANNILERQYSEGFGRCFDLFKAHQAKEGKGL